MGRFGLAGWLVALGMTVACGGIATRRLPSDDDGGESGGSTVGGISAAGSGLATGGSLAQGGNQAAGGNTAAGGPPIAAAGRPSVGSCVYNGNVYEVGSTFTASDNCNICKCERNGTTSCTTTACQQPDACAVLDQNYSVWVSSAVFCTSDAQCTMILPSAASCGCPMWVNSSDTDDVRLALQAEEQFRKDCANNVACASCAPLQPARCQAGRCVSASGVQ